MPLKHTKMNWAKKCFLTSTVWD